MSLLTYLPAGSIMDEDALRRGSYANPDGNGFALATHERIIVRRSLACQPLLKDLEVLRREYPRAPALFHSERATRGWGIVENCHPFAIGDDPSTVTAQNGPLPRAVRPRKKDPRSAMRLAAEEYLPAFGPLCRRRNRIRLERWLRRDSAAVILTHDSLGGQGFLINERAGTWYRGVWYSGNDYLPYAGLDSSTT